LLSISPPLFSLIFFFFFSTSAYIHSSLPNSRKLSVFKLPFN
jgi:hypothetical protein